MTARAGSLTGTGTASWLLRAGGVLAACLVALPLVFLVLRASQAGWATIGALISSAHVAGLLANTVLLAAATTLLCVVIGVGAAWLVERTELPGRQFWAVILVLPAALPDFVVGYGWVSLVPSFHGFPAAVVIMTSTLYPLVYLPVAASLRQFDPLLGEIGQSLGLGPVRNFLRVVLPQLRASILGGGLLVVLGILAEYGAFEIVRFQTFTTAIFTEFTLGFDTPGACAQSLVLVGLGLVVLVGEQRAGGRAPHVRSGPGVRRQVSRTTGNWRWLFVAGLVLLTAVSLGMPLFSIGYWLFQGNSSTLPRADLGQPALNTLLYGAAAAALATLLAVPVARLSVRHRSRMGVALEKAAYLPQAIPGVVVGLSLVFFAVNFFSVIYQTPVLLIGAYTILFFPLALIAIRASAVHAPARLDEAAASLGVSRTSAFFRITLPILLPGLAASFALVFLGSATELTATLLLHPTGVQTLATQFWRYTSEVSYGAAAPYAAVIVAISLPAALLVSQRVERWPRTDKE